MCHVLPLTIRNKVANFNAIALGLGATVRQYDWMGEAGNSISSNDYTGILSLDWICCGAGFFRLSSAIATRQTDVDAAFNFLIKRFIIDTEGFIRNITPDGAEQEQGAYCGLDYMLNEIVSIAARADYLNRVKRAACGVKLSLSNDLFVAVEAGRNMPVVGEAYNELFLQFGLESTLKLPGFQRRTLTRN